ncbi:unnamed protein product [Cyclocybe aegerita]|uniref:Uncharacterized protein n=1 Tax=Cyclocybe aegerita TaxID=1973307 RepID=A0A8S0W3U2_CYCAE|nr:unnamed protein product [Cyclocybe aegerita]
MLECRLVIIAQLRIGGLNIKFSLPLRQQACSNSSLKHAIPGSHYLNLVASERPTSHRPIHIPPGIEMKLFAFTKYAFVVAVLATMGNAGPTPATESEGTPATFITSNTEFDHWLATTEANITWVGGKAPNPLAPRSASDTTVAYCNELVDGRCQGYCNVFTGSGVCINTPFAITCIYASNNVFWCDNLECTGSCAFTANCHRIPGGFCYTPNANSINIP